MPIKPENKNRYPRNWKEISERIIQRANNRCEICGVRNHAVGFRDEEGAFIPLSGNLLLEDYGNGLDPNRGEMVSYKLAKEVADFNTMNCEKGNKYIVIVLTVSHLDHQPENCDLSNLKAMCQRCHNRYDQKHRKETISKSKLINQLSIRF
jgi:hypothetical protein